jgi:hypothetical protein
MNLSEISIAFKNCNGDVKSSFKDFLINQNFGKEELTNGITIQKANNYILRDVNYLVNKSILNICACDLLIKKGYFHWGFITSYYSNFFSIQSLNRLKLNFNTWTNSGIDCTLVNYNNQELEVKFSNSSGGSHESQFNRFYENYQNFRNRKSIDRYWGLGIHPFKMRFEALLRNEINYQIEESFYYELNLDYDDFIRIIEDNKNDPSKTRSVIKSPINYSLPNLELALARLRVNLYILNYIANANIEYKSYFIRDNKARIKNIKLKYPNCSLWILEKFEEWLTFQEIETDDILI